VLALLTHLLPACRVHGTFEDRSINGSRTRTKYGYDGHGNVRFLTNSAGTITDSYDYDSFGMPVRTSGTTPNGYFYSGERLDSNIGLYDLRSRYYNQATGRFWARDRAQLSPFNPANLNAYSYVTNNPVNLIDPTGHDALVEDEIEESTIVRTIVPKYVPPPSQIPGVLAGGPPQWAQIGGIFLITLAVDCGFQTIGTGINALYQTGNLGHPQTLYWNGWCNLASKPYKPQPEPEPEPSPSPSPSPNPPPCPPTSPSAGTEPQPQPEPEPCQPPNPDCSKASDWQLGQAGIDDPHQFKKDYLGNKAPISQFDICACKDGSITIKARGQCGKPGPTIDTGYRWK
jgi:RHS repeat-associated protein